MPVCQYPSEGPGSGAWMCNGWNFYLGPNCYGNQQWIILRYDGNGNNALCVPFDASAHKQLNGGIMIPVTDLAPGP